MKIKIKTILTFFVLIVLITGLYFFTDWFSKVTGYFTGEDEKKKFANCLAEEGAVLYVSEDCVDCHEQERILGDDFLNIIEKINCGEEKCLGLKTVPAWEINKSFYYGKKEIREIEEISSCVVN